MLQAYLHLKLNHLSGGPPDALSDSDAERDLTWSNAVRANEDSLTAMVFSRLFYLPQELMSEILSRAVARASPNGRPAVDLFGPPGDTKVRFWPGLKPHPDDVEAHRRSVEPDMMVVAQDRVIVIEVKWHQQQNPVGQWAVQIRAVHELYCRDAAPSRRIEFLAVGGLPYPKVRATELPAQLESKLPDGAVVHFHMLYWEDLYEEILAALRGPPLPREQRRILEDVRSALADRGLRELLSMESMPCPEHFDGSMPQLRDAWSSPLPFEPFESLSSLSPALIPPEQLSSWSF